MNNTLKIKRQRYNMPHIKGFDMINLISFCSHIQSLFELESVIVVTALYFEHTAPITYLFSLLQLYVERIKILEAAQVLLDKQHGKSSPLPSKLDQIGCAIQQAKIMNGSRIIFSLFIYYFFKFLRYETIETHSRAFLRFIILSIAGVNCFRPPKACALEVNPWQSKQRAQGKRDKVWPSGYLCICFPYHCI